MISLGILRQHRGVDLAQIRTGGQTTEEYGQP
jgi:hypothetical protein